MLAALLIACAAAAAAGCGKKGPPLAPIVHVPAAVDKLTATRIGNDVYLSVTIPTQNIDTTERIQNYKVRIYGIDVRRFKSSERRPILEPVRDVRDLRDGTGTGAVTSQ